MAIFSYIEIQYDKLTTQINNWIKGKYDKSDILLSPASPYGQIVDIMKEFFQWNLIYTKNAVNTINIVDTTNEKAIKYLARISGHNPSRAIGASGSLRFKLKGGISIDKEIKGGVVVINNKTTLKNKSNNLFYTIDLGTTNQTYPMTSDAEFYVQIIQGKYETQKFTGTGLKNQTIQLNIPSTANIDNFKYNIVYNGIAITVRDGLYDLLTNEYSCYTRTGFNGGIDIYFGTGYFGFIPEQGSIIEISYLLTNGKNGEILTPTANDFKFIDSVYDGEGNEIKIEKLFDIMVYTDINFAADNESVDYTKAAIPFVSRNFVLATPSQYIYHLTKLNMFSKINAFNKLDDNDFSVNETVVESSLEKLRQSILYNSSKEQVDQNLNDLLTKYTSNKRNMNDNEIYLYLIPDVRKYFNNDVNYFNVPLDVFYLDTNEQEKIQSYLRSLGTMSVTVELNIIQPKITRYVMNVYVRRFSNVPEENIKQDIISQCSNYFITNTRFDRIPKSDFISIISNVNGVDSVEVHFISQQNEDYHRKAQDLGYSVNPIVKPLAPGQINIFNTAKPQPVLAQPRIMKNGVFIENKAYNPNITLGLDPIQGDIVMAKDEYAIIRGDFYTRDGVYFYENPNEEGKLTSINVVFNGKTEK